MENGQTVQEVLSDRDSDKYTPVITNSSSTFKVGQGDNVDLSSSMKEGAYDSCVLKGKTMVNCTQEPSSKDVVLPYEFADGRYVTINDTKESGALGVELKGQTLVNLIDFSKFPNASNATRNNDTITVTATTDSMWINCSIPLNNIVNDKTYIVCWDSLNFTHTHSNGITEVIGIYTFDENGKNQRTIAKTVSNENNYIKFNIPSSMTFTYVKIKIHATTYGSELGATTTVKGVKVIEYQEGMENWNIPYFEGMASCKMPTLHTVGKNLFDGELEAGSLSEKTGTNETSSSRKRSINFIRVSPNTSYKFSVNGVVNAGRLFLYDQNKTFIRSVLAREFSSTQSNEHYMKFRIEQADMAQGENIQIEEGSTATSYENHKSSILSLPEEVVLRSLPNGVCDTFNTRTGVYTQRIGEVVLNGENYTGFSKDSALENDTTCKYFISNFFSKYLNGKGGQNEKVVLNCNYLPPVSFNHMQDKTLSTYPCIANSGAGSLNLRVGKDIDSTSLLLAYLQSNPITIQYELATPIITKINLPSTLKSWNTTTHIYSEIPENTLYPTLTHSNPTYPVILKPSTKYSIVANSYSNNHTNSTINFNLGGATASTTVGNRVTTITTPSTLTSELLTMSGRGNKLNNVMVIEGDVVGDEPYFEGICDCKSPILSNVGKNLFNLNKLTHSISVDTVNQSFTIPTTGYNYNILTGTAGSNASQVNHMNKLLRLKPNTTYTYSVESISVSNGLNKGLRLFLYDEKAVKGVETANIGYNNKFTQTFTTDETFLYAGIISSGGDSSVITMTKLQIEESPTRTVYEPYKSNTTTFNQKDDKTIVLRSLPNGVCDTLNVETGEHVQRIGETSNFTVYTRFDSQELLNTHLFTIVPPQNMKTGSSQYIICDKFSSLDPNGGGGLWDGDKEGFSRFEVAKYLRLRILKSKCSTVEELRAWLQSNPITIQYELATPIVTTIDVQGFPYAYTNGHVQLSSGSIEQSLTPKVEYSLSVNKTGQINSNTKRVSAHQKQLDDFEAMMLTQMVQSAYDKAILQFDYEMQMMSLGGE